jgi:hypothetical protein
MKNINDKEKSKVLSQEAVMPCFVFYQDRHGIERIGMAEKRIDDEWFAIWFNSTTRDVCRYEDAVLCPYQNEV